MGMEKFPSSNINHMSSSSSLINCSFFQPLLPGFLYTFSMPVSFAKKLEGQLKENELLKSVVLMRENGLQRHWTVQVQGGRHFKTGWMDFSLHNNLQVGDFVVFRHMGSLVFQVSVFDPVTACICEPQPSTPTHPLNLKGSNSMKVEPKQSKGPCCEVNLSAYYVKHKTVFLPKEFTRMSGLANRCCDVTIIDGEKRSWQVNLRHRSDSYSYFRRGWKELEVANSFRRGDLIKFQLLKTGKKPVLKCSRIATWTRE